MKSLKKAFVMGVVVLIVLLMQIESFAAEDWELAEEK
jgi:hypothetical protein